MKLRILVLFSCIHLALSFQCLGQAKPHNHSIDSTRLYKQKIASMRATLDSTVTAYQLKINHILIDKKRRDMALNIGALVTKMGDQKIRIEELEAKNKRNLSIIYASGILLLLFILGLLLSRFIKQIRYNKQLAVEKLKHLERIKEQSNVLTDIAYIQAHEIRGPIATMLGLLYMLKDNKNEDPGNPQLIADIISVTEKLDMVVSDIVLRENNINHSNSVKP